ncbi:hypothetical protein, partial [Streptomyces alfalfae]
MPSRVNAGEWSRKRSGVASETERSAVLASRSCRSAVSYTHLTLPTNREAEIYESTIQLQTKTKIAKL